MKKPLHHNGTKYTSPRGTKGFIVSRKWDSKTKCWMVKLNGDPKVSYSLNSLKRKLRIVK